MGVKGHHRQSSHVTVRCAVLTVSDSRTEIDDVGGALIREQLSAAGHVVSEYQIVPDEPERIHDALFRFLEDPDTDVVVVTGGTGIAERDHTPDVVRESLTREIPGFGELFRSLSYQEIGAAAMLSRAIAGVSGNKIVFCLPGSPAGVRLALEKLIVPEIRHMVSELRR